MNNIPHIKNGNIVGYISFKKVDLAGDSLSAFCGDGKAYREVTSDIINKIIDGTLIITEYHEQPLGNVIYIEAVSINN